MKLNPLNLSLSLINQHYFQFKVSPVRHLGFQSPDNRQIPSLGKKFEVYSNKYSKKYSNISFIVITLKKLDSICF